MHVELRISPHEKTRRRKYTLQSDVNTMEFEYLAHQKLFATKLQRKGLPTQTANRLHRRRKRITLTNDNVEVANYLHIQTRSQDGDAWVGEHHPKLNKKLS